MAEFSLPVARLPLERLLDRLHVVSTELHGWFGCGPNPAIGEVIDELDDVVDELAACLGAHTPQVCVACHGGDHQQCLGGACVCIHGVAALPVMTDDDWDEILDSIDASPRLDVAQHHALWEKIQSLKAACLGVKKETYESEPVQPRLDRSEGSADSTSGIRADHRASPPTDEGGDYLRLSELQGDADSQKLGAACLGAPQEQEPKLVAVVDGRCGCKKCEASSPNLYRMIGVCYNCGAKPILMLFRAGDPAADQDCPICGKRYGVHSQRLATPDEIPAAVLPPSPQEKNEDLEARVDRRNEV